MVNRNVDIAIRARDRASKKFDKISRATGGMTRAFKSAAAAAAAFLSARALVRFTKSVIKVASDTEEIGSKFNAVFKDLTEAADAWALSFAESVGRSNLEIKTFLATLQDTFVPLGFARDKAKEMSQTMTELAVDIASFNNKADADVIRDLQSAIVGNTETVRKYGVIITQVTLGQELLNSGMAKNVKRATEAQKAQARLNIIQRSTTDAQGDAIRTASSYANQVKRLQANLTNLRATIGDRILPSVNRFTTAINKNFDVVEKWSIRTVDFVTRVKNAIDSQLAPVFKSSAERIRDWASENRENIGDWAQRSVDFVVNVKDSLVNFASFMKNDFTAAMDVVWDNFLILLKAAFDSAIILSVAAGKGIAEGLKAGASLAGFTPDVQNEVARRFQAAGGTFGTRLERGQQGPVISLSGPGNINRAAPSDPELFSAIRRQVIAEANQRRIQQSGADIAGSAFPAVAGIFGQAFTQIGANTQAGQGRIQEPQTLRSRERGEAPVFRQMVSRLDMLLLEIQKLNSSVPGTGQRTLRLANV